MSCSAQLYFGLFGFTCCHALNHQTHNGGKKGEKCISGACKNCGLQKLNVRLKSTCSTFGKVAEAGGGRDRGQVVFSNPQQILALTAGVEAVLLQVSGSQEGAGVEIFPRELDNLLGLDPAAVHKLEALQVDNLKKKTQPTHTVLSVLRPFSVQLIVLKTTCRVLRTKK